MQGKKTNSAQLRALVCTNLPLCSCFRQKVADTGCKHLQSTVFCMRHRNAITYYENQVGAKVMTMISLMLSDKWCKAGKRAATAITTLLAARCIFADAKYN